MQLSKSSCPKDQWRGERQDRDEPRAQRVRRKNINGMWERCQSSPHAAGSGETRAPKSIIQEGKKDMLDLLIVFMEIRAVTEFAGEI